MSAGTKTRYADALDTLRDRQRDAVGPLFLIARPPSPKPDPVDDYDPDTAPIADDVLLIHKGWLRLADDRWANVA